MMEVYVNIKETKYTGLEVEIISENEYDKRYDEVYRTYFNSLEVFQVFLDVHMEQKEFKPENVMEKFSEYCIQKTDDEMFYKWEKMEVVGA